MIALGHGDEYRNDLIKDPRAKKYMDTDVDGPGTSRKANTIGEYTNGSYFKAVIAPKVQAVENYINKTVLADPSKNPYEGWTGQGYTGDINRSDNYWKMARAYFWLQKDGKVTNILVEEVYNEKQPIKTTFIFNGEKIKEYFSKNPDQLKSVPLYDYNTRGKKGTKSGGL